MGIVLLFFAIKSLDYFFDFEKKVSHFSENISESKKNNLFVSNLKLYQQHSFTNPQLFKVLNLQGWIEKSGDYRGSKLENISDKYLSIVF